MQEDHFYSDYNERTLVIHGVVASLAGGVLQFQAQNAFTTRCVFDHDPGTLQPGEPISVVAEGAAAERLPSAVLLRGCHLLAGG